MKETRVIGPCLSDKITGNYHTTAKWYAYSKEGICPCCGECHLDELKNLDWDLETIEVDVNE